jgi:hypothetical protein
VKIRTWNILKYLLWRLDILKRDLCILNILERKDDGEQLVNDRGTAEESVEKPVIRGDIFQPSRKGRHVHQNRLEALD